MLQVRIASALLVIAGLLYAHWDALRGMIALWHNSPMYSYGYLVPVVAGYLVWVRREALVTLRPRPARWAGAAVLMLWASMLIVGKLVGLQTLQQLALIPAIVGCVLCLLGFAYLRTAWAGIAYLLLMIPIWDVFTEPLHQPFQNRSALIGVELLRAVGIPASREGVYVILPNVTLEVARACSGVNYLVAVIALGLPLAYLYQRSLWRRIVLIGSAVVVAALSNGMRVALIGVLAYFELSSALHGPFHVLQGLFVAGIGYVVLFLGLRVLAEGPVPATAGTAASYVRSDEPGFGLLAPLVVATVLVSTGVALEIYRPRAVHLVSPLDRLPESLGKWGTEPFVRPSRVDWWPNADQRLARRYRSDDGTIADVFIAYFETQEQNREVVSHKAAAIHQAAERRRLTAAPSESVVVNLVTNDKSPDPSFSMFWYELDGYVEVTPFAAKLRTMWSVVGRGHSNGAVVMVTTPIRPEQARDVQLDQLQDLAARVYGALADCLPGRRSRIDLSSSLAPRLHKGS